MEEDIKEIESLEAIIATESAAAHEALRLELDNYDELSFSSAEDTDDESNNDLPTIPNAPLPIGLNRTESLDDCLLQLSAHLTSEELARITQCPKEDDGLKRCMILNRSKRLELLQAYKHYANLMLTVVTEDEVIVKAPARKRGSERMCATLCKTAAPYFKVDKGFTHAPNEDVLRMRENGELPCYFTLNTKRRWTIENQTNLKGAIRYNFFTNKNTKLERDVKLLQNRLKASKNPVEQKSFSVMITNVEKEIGTNKDNYVKHFPTLYSDEFIDWEEISLKDLQGKFSPATCKAMWRLYLHPQVNKGDMKGDELERIHEIAARHDYQRWENIADELGGNRSPYLLCVQFYTSMVDRYVRVPFTAAESAKLESLAERYRISVTRQRLGCRAAAKDMGYIPWAKVAREFGNSRSRLQLYMHYMYRLKDRDRRKFGPFSVAEDVQILYLVGKYGENFPLISETLNRSASQLRARYLMYLKPQHAGHQGVWTLEDDRYLLDRADRKRGRYAAIAREMDRPVSSIRCRYLTLRKYLNAGVTMEDMPRRKQKPKFITARNQSRILADTLVESKTPLDIEKIRRTLEPLGPPSDRRNIGAGRPTLLFDCVDQQLIEYFKTTGKVGRSLTQRTIPDEALTRCAASIRNVFALLEVTQLNIPSNAKLQKNYSHRLDDVDYGLLDILRNDTVTGDSEDERLFLPPNSTSLTALRSLILANKSEQAGNVKLSDIRAQFENDLNDVNLQDRCDVSSARAEFTKRFETLFLWPSILSLQSVGDDATNYVEPPSHLEPPSLDLDLTKPKQRGRPKKNLTKIRRMNDVRMKKRETELAVKIGARVGVSRISAVTQIALDDEIPSTSKESESTKPQSSAATKVVLNASPATSVEEVKELLKAGHLIGPVNTLVRIDKKTMQKLQKERVKRSQDLESLHPNRALKRIRLDKSFGECSASSSKPSRCETIVRESDADHSFADLLTNIKNEIDNSENSTLDRDLKMDISKLDQILNTR